DPELVTLTRKSNTITLNLPKSESGHSDVSLVVTDSLGISSSAKFNVRFLSPSLIAADGVKWPKISVSSDFSAAIRSDGTLEIWGSPDKHKGYIYPPQNLKGLVGLFSGSYYTYAITDQGGVVYWGEGAFGQNRIPEGLKDLVSMSLGHLYTIALDSQGKVFAWGWGYGERHYDDAGLETPGQLPDGLTNIKAIASGLYHNLALKNDGTVMAWGKNEYGQTDVPEDLSDVIGIACGDYHSLAIKRDGTVVGWGLNDDGQCDPPDELNDVLALSAGNRHSLALIKDGSLVTWGTTAMGLGQIPVEAKDIAFIESGANHNLALSKSGKLFAWGENSHNKATVPASFYKSGNTGVDGGGSGEPFGEPVTYTNIATTLIGQVTINGTAAREGDVVAFYVGEELRGKQAVNIDINGDYSAAGTAWLNAQVHAAGGEETSTISVYEVSTGITHDKVGLSVEIKPKGEAGAFAEPLLIQMDNVAPELTLLGEVQVTIDQRTTYADAGASATDNVDGDLTSKIVVTGAVDTSTAGTYTLKYDVSDAAGNAAESVSRTVVVEKTTVIQTLNLKAGWNLISFYVESEDMTPATVLASIKGNLAQIKDLKSSYNPALPAFINTLKGLNVEDGYWVKVDADVSFDLEGEVPAGGSIPVRSGWNLVGYPRENGAAPANELTSLGDMVLQFKNLKDSYNPALPAFINTLKVITPGLGYWLKVSEDGVWNVGDVSGDGGNRDISKMGLGDSRWGQVVVYPNVSATVLAEATVEGKAVSRGSVVGAFVEKELRGQHEVVLAGGRSYATLNVNLSEAEKVSFRIWEAGSESEYGVTKTMTLEMGEMYGSAEAFVKLDGVALDSGSTIRIEGYVREPFGFGFEGQMGSSYVVEATGDLKEWGVVKTYNGTGTMIRFEDERDQVFPQIYYRVRMVE
ncbi:MAG: immunoglobulin-like domain-containing protein, partial [Rhodospirillales bacterium]